MCGITGIFSHSSPIDEAILKKSVAALIHRGPDCQKTWLSADHMAGLGHARLSIIDLVSGDQPLSNQGGTLRLVANGEFYGFEQQREALKQLNHRFLTNSDSEIAIHLYEEYGAACLQHLRGEYAFILWDENKNLCFAARDRFGIKPLFYSVHQGKLYIASEIKSLFAAGVPAMWDRNAMAIFSKSTLHLHDQTPYKGVYQIPPGHYLIAVKDQIKLYKYWDFDYPKIDDVPKTSEDYVAGLRAQLEDAIRVRLRADVPIACYLSGGLDSSTVLGIAAAHSTQKIPAFTLSFEREEYDEYHIAKEMAQISNSEFIPISINQQDLADNFSDAVTHGETFLFNGHAVAKFLLSKAVHKAGYKVVLTGEGADELFAGYPHFRFDKLFYAKNHYTDADKQQALETLLKNNVISAGLLMPDADNMDIKSITERLGFTPAWLAVAGQSAVKIAEVMNEDFAKANEGLDVFNKIMSILDIENQLIGRHPVNQSLYLWSKFRLPHYILTVLGDRMEMAHSIEGRVPFLDHHVAEYMAHIPVDFKIHDMTEKYLLREAAKPVISDTVYKRQKHPFLAPPASLDPKQPFHDLLQSTLRSKALADVPFFDQNKIISLLDRLPSLSIKESVAWDTILMTVLSACILQERFSLSA